MTKKMDFSLLKTLTQLPGLSGREDAVRNCLEETLSSYADSVRIDTLGNLILTKKGTSGKTLLLCAHMDEVGLMVRFIDERGFIRFVTVGGIDPRTLLAQRIRVQTSKGPLLGVIGTKPAHITTEVERGKAVPLCDLFIDLGFPAEQVRQLVSVGDPIVLDRSYEEFGEGLISAKAIDNRGGVFILAEVLKQLNNPYYTVQAVFSVQEEVGVRGATTAAYGIDADVSLCLDTTGAADIPGVATQDYIVRLGNGVGISVLDSMTITPKSLFDEIVSLCKKHDIAYQVRIAQRGGNDAGAIHLSKTGVPTCALSLPTRNIHSNVEVCAKKDVQAMFDLTLLCAQEGLHF